jgi:hypothetical protein
VSSQLPEGVYGVALWATTTDFAVWLSYNVTNVPLSFNNSIGKPSSAQPSKRFIEAALLVMAETDSVELDTMVVGPDASIQTHSYYSGMQNQDRIAVVHLGGVFLNIRSRTTILPLVGSG